MTTTVNEVEQQQSTEHAAPNANTIMSFDYWKALAYAHIHQGVSNGGVNRAPVIVGLESLGISTPRWAIGTPVASNDSYSHRHIPDGTVCATTMQRHRVVFGINGGEVHTLIQTADSYTRGVRESVAEIISMSDVNRYVHRLGTSADWLQIKSTMESLHRIGVDAKAAQDWCGEYERTVGRLGISAETIGLRRNNELLRPSEVAELPEGTILRSPHPSLDPHLYIRDDDVTTNTARTRRITVQEGGDGHYEPLLEVAGVIGGSPLPWLLSERELLRIPVGTQVTYHSGGVYEKREEWRLHETRFESTINVTQVPPTGFHITGLPS